MKEVIIAAILAVLLSLSGCTIMAPYDRDNIGLWDQQVYHEVEGIGMHGVSQFGPWYLGSFKSLWKRNVKPEAETPGPAKPRGAIAPAGQVAALKPPPVPVMLP